MVEEISRSSMDQGQLGGTRENVIADGVNMPGTLPTLLHRRSGENAGSMDEKGFSVDNRPSGVYPGTPRSRAGSARSLHSRASSLPGSRHEEEVVPRHTGSGMGSGTGSFLRQLLDRKESHQQLVKPADTREGEDLTAAELRKIVDHTTSNKEARPTDPLSRGIGQAQTTRQNSQTGHTARSGIVRTTTLSRLMGRSNRELKRKEGYTPPPWMSEDLIAETHEAVWTSTEPRSLLRSQNLTLQTELHVWTMLRNFSSRISGENVSDADITEMERPVMEYIEQQRIELLMKLSSQEWLLLHDPVGAVPLHQCFLLGMTDLGKHIAERFYCTPEMISVPYGSDMDAWKNVGVVLDGDGIDDGGLYTGETVLHIAIVNQNVELVDWLLKRGINLGSRACGAFFRPEVIRREVEENPSLGKRLLAFVQGRDLRNDPIVITTANSDSACYYGEFPLSFAASIGNVEMCAMLKEQAAVRQIGKSDVFLAQQYDYQLSRKKESAQAQQLQAFAVRTGSSKMLTDYTRKDDLSNHAVFKPGQPLDFFLNAQDSLGNTALHLAVMYQRKESVDWLLQNGGKNSLDVLNDDGFTPLTLAARLGLVKIFHHVISQMREKVWSYGNVQMSKTSLEQIDTYRIRESRLHSRPKWRSALDIIVRHEVEAFASDQLFNKIIMDKWNQFGRRVYFTRTFIPYTIIIIMFSVMLSLRCEELRTYWLLHFKGIGPHMADHSVDFSWRLMWDASEANLVTSVLQTILMAICMPWLLFMGWKNRRLGPKDYDPNEDGEISAQELMLFFYKNLTFFLNYSSSIAICIAYVAAYSRDRETQRLELQVWAVTSILLWCNFLNLLMPFKFFGILVIIIYKMLIGDFFKFLVVYLIMVSGFAQGLFCLYQMADFPEALDSLDTHPGQSALKLAWVSLGEVDNLKLIDQTANPSLTLAMYLIWVMLSTVLLINLLIAMMGQTFDLDMEDTHKSWIFPFAHLVLTTERMLSAEDRVKYRSGTPGRAVSDTNFMTLKQEPYFEIVVEEDRLLLARTHKIKEQHKAHRVVIQAIRDFGNGMKECVADLKVLRDAMADAEEDHGVRYVMPERLLQWLPPELRGGELSPRK